MTQAMQFSAFKGPFAERIDVWNGKLYMVSKGIIRVLEVSSARPTNLGDSKTCTIESTQLRSHLPGECGRPGKVYSGKD